MFQHHLSSGAAPAAAMDIVETSREEDAELADLLGSMKLAQRRGHIRSTRRIGRTNAKAKSGARGKAKAKSKVKQGRKKSGRTKSQANSGKKTARKRR